MTKKKTFMKKIFFYIINQNNQATQKNAYLIFVASKEFKSTAKGDLVNWF